MTELFMLVVFAALCGWIVYALARVQAAWESGQRRTTEMRRTFTSGGLALMRDVETIQKLDDEIKRVKDRMADALRDQQDKHAALAKSVRPPPPDVYVTSEYPPSQKDTAWIATFVRDSKHPQEAWELEPKPMLIWGHTQTAAITRARQLIQDYKTYSVAEVAPFTAL